MTSNTDDLVGELTQYRVSIVVGSPHHIYGINYSETNRRRDSLFKSAYAATSIIKVIPSRVYIDIETDHGASQNPEVSILDHLITDILYRQIEKDKIIGYG